MSRGHRQGVRNVPRSNHRWPNLLIPLGIIVSVVVILRASTTLQQPAPTPSADSPHVARHPVIIRQPDGPPTIDTGRRDAEGKPITANCSTCHATRPANPLLHDGAQLTEFHQGLTTRHGELSCLSCHNRDDYQQLRLADGRPLAFADSMRLCAQCHGPQFRDYQNGTHGGMVGYWDLTRGGRYRNHCVDCHDAHAPQFPQVMPVLRPNDRFLRDDVHDTHTDEEAGHE